MSAYRNSAVNGELNAFCFHFPCLYSLYSLLLGCSCLSQSFHLEQAVGSEKGLLKLNAVWKQGLCCHIRFAQHLKSALGLCVLP